MDLPEPELELELELESLPPPAVPGSLSKARPLVHRQAHNSLCAGCSASCRAYHPPALPLLLKTLSANSVFPLTLHGTRVVFLLLEQKSAELTTEAEVFLTLLTKFVSGEAETGEAQPGWMRVFAMEVMRAYVFLL